MLPATPPSPRAEGPAGRSTAALTQHPSPRQTASPSCGDGRYRQAGTLLASHASPSEGVDGMLSCAGPPWASVVRDGAQPRSSPPISPPIPLSTPTAAVTRDELLALYERCVASGLKARFAVRYVAGVQEASLTCSLSPPISATNAPTIKRRRRRHRRRVLAATVATDTPPLADVAMTSKPLPCQMAPSTAHARPLTPPAAPSAPPQAPISSLETSPPATPPPAKRTRRAVKRRCEVELLRGEGWDGELVISPLSCTSPPPSISLAAYAAVSALAAINTSIVLPT
jgi:hypothetical protein